MTTFDCIIVDDENNALDILEAFIGKIDFLKLVGRCTDAFQANEILCQMHVDLVFLDINLPQLSGLEMIKALDTKPKVIFTTAHKEHAIDAFEINAVDYLLKPFSFDRFLLAASRIRAGEQKTLSSSQITVNHNRKYVNIPVDSIYYIQALGNYVKIHTDTDVIITYEGIASVLSKLPIGLFIQVHKSYVVNRSRIDAFNTRSVVVRGVAVPVGRTFKGLIHQLKS